MFSKNKWWWKLHILFIILFIGLLVSMMTYVNYCSKHSFTSHKDSLQKEFQLQFDLSKYWNELSHGYKYGMQYDGVIRNFMPNSMSDWNIQIELPPNCHLDSFWNGEFTLSGNILTIKSDHNSFLIKSNSQQTFGFVLYSSELTNILDYSVTYYKPIRLADLLLFKITLGLFITLVIIDIIVLCIAYETRQFERKQEESRNIINQSLLTFANIIDAKDPYTKGHSQRVAIYSRELAKRMGLSESDQQRVFYIALLHDIGKIGIPDAILNKKGSLTQEERHIIEEHVSIGGDILSSFISIPNIEDGARYHHEWYNGSGYASGLSGDDIPLLARIICVADSFDAMSSARCYRPQLPIEMILHELEHGAGTQFDPSIVTHMIAMIHEGIAPVLLSEEAIFQASNTSA